MADNVTFSPTVATAPTGTVVRTKDRSGVETQVMGLDTNPGGSTERLTTSPDENLPARIKDLDMSIRNLIAAIASSPSKDAFDRLQVFVNGGALGALTTLTTLTTVTNPVYQVAPGGSLAPQQFQPFGQIAWALNTRARITNEHNDQYQKRTR